MYLERLCEGCAPSEIVICSLSRKALRVEDCEMDMVRSLVWGFINSFDTATYLLTAVILILSITLRVKASRYRRHKATRKAAHKATVTALQKEKEGLKAQLERKKPQEWYPVGVLMPRVKILEGELTYALVEFNPYTGETRAAPPEQRFFTPFTNWEKSGGAGVPLSLLGAPEWRWLTDHTGHVSDIVLCNEVYHFRYGTGQPRIGNEAPRFQLIEGEPQEAPRRLTTAS